MSLFSKNPLLLAYAQQEAAGGISRSLRFNSSDSAYLSRTPASAGNRKTWTWAGWVKRSKLGASGGLLGGVISPGLGGNWAEFLFSTDKLGFQSFNASGYNWYWETTAVFRDSSAWYHIVIVCDQTQSTVSNAIKFYVNGVQAAVSTTPGTWVTNQDLQINATCTHNIGKFDWTAEYFNGYLADIYFIDGQALTPSSFTETDATTGQLIPKAYTGSYGTNGFHLEFADNSSNTATTLGKDTSGNSPANNWTPNNLSVTAGAGNDSVTDVPTNGSQTDTGVGGEVRGNYCTLNPLRLGPSAALLNGNLDYSKTSGGNYGLAVGTFAVPLSGKWYWEVVPTSNPAPSDLFYTGITETTSASTNYLEQTGVSCGYVPNGNIAYSGGSGAYGSTWTTNDVIGIAVDMDNGAIYFAKNGTWQNSGVPTSGASKTGAARTNIAGASFYPSCASNGSSNSFTATFNFGARPFAYTAPSGFKALCTANLPAPLVTKPSTVMDILLWTGTGTGADRTISGLGFSNTPGLIWGKGRSVGYHHTLWDIVRGYGLTNVLSSDRTEGQGWTASGRIKTATSSSITWEADSGSLWYDGSSTTYVAWAWDAGSSTVTNTQGSITSSVRANATAGFSVVTYTGNGSSGATVGHGLGVKPSLIICKNRDASDNWIVQHTSQGAGKAGYLNTTDAFFTSSFWGSTEPTSTVFSVGDQSNVNGNGVKLVAYCFAPVSGYSSFGSYTGNGSTDGPFVYTGFRPRWLMIKQTNASGNDWYIWDSARESYNLAGKSLQANTSNAEPSIGGPYSATLDILSNGFKPRDSGAGSNGSSSTYIYAAFAESPFNYSRAR